MKRVLQPRPIAAAIATALADSSRAPSCHISPHHAGSAHIGLLPLGVMVAAMVLSMDSAVAATEPTPAEQVSPAKAAESAKAAASEKAPSPKETTLDAVTVKALRDSEAKGYQGGTTQIGKLPQLTIDIPQSVTVVPEQLIDDRNADTLKEALRNVPSLTFNAGEGGRIGDNITLRGYSIVGDLYLDGIRDVAQYNRETFNLQQIDVLRGSASTLFGRGSTGGLVNQVSKTPLLKDANEVKTTYGSFDYKRVTTDLNEAIGENSAVRLNAMYTDTDSFRDEVHQSRWGIAPSIAWGIGTANELTLSYYYLQDDNIPDYGVPYFEGKPLNVPVERFYGLANANYETNETGIATSTYIHRFSNDTNVKTVLRAADYERDLFASAPRIAGAPAVITDATVINRGRQWRAGQENTLTSQTDFTTKFDTGDIKHEVLLGAELAREDAERWNWRNPGAAIPVPTTTVGNPDANPLLPAGFLDREKNPTSIVSYEASTVGLYFQDTLQFTPAWKVVLGARHDDFEADYDRPEPQGDLSRVDRVWSYRSGLLYQPAETQTYYVSYGTSFNPSGELYSLDDRGTNTPPEESRNIELGAKWDLLDGDLSLRTALFRSEKTNERNTDLAVSIEENLLSGRRHTDGIELEAAGRITPNWQVFATAASLKGIINEATGSQANTLGKTPINTPDYTASLWSVYKFGSGWRVGGGFEAVGARFANADNTNEVPSYTRWDALLSYDQKEYEVKLNVFNLFDEKYYEAVYQGHTVPGTTRAVQLTYEVKF